MKTEVYCFGCHAKLRVPSTGKGNIVCPHCNHRLTVENGKITSSAISNEAKRRNNKQQFNSIAFIVIFFVSCILFFSFKDNAFDWFNTKVGDSTRPKLELVNNSVHVYNLSYTVGFTGFNEVNTNIADFDELVWDQLKGSVGIRNIIRHNKIKDQYGNIVKSEQEFGSVNLNELNKYQTFDDFKKAGGFYAIITKQ